MLIRRLMMLKDVILESESEHEIYFLLTAYLEALHHCDKPDALPQYLKDMPLSSVDDVRARFEQTSSELIEPSELSENWRHAIVQEAADILEVAFNRLQCLAGKRQGMP